MALSRRKFSAEFKLWAVRQVKAGASTAAVARRYDIRSTLLTKWRKQRRQDPERTFGVGFVPELCARVMRIKDAYWIVKVTEVCPPPGTNVHPFLITSTTRAV